MTQPETLPLAKCPNPECLSPTNLRVFKAVKSEVSGGDRWQVVHDYCGVHGPLADTPEEAARLFIALCSPYKPEAEAVAPGKIKGLAEEFKLTGVGSDANQIYCYCACKLEELIHE